MNIKSVIKILSLWMALACLSQPAEADVLRLRGRETYVSGQMLVRFKEGASSRERDKVLGALGRSVALPHANLYKVFLLPGQDVRGAVVKVSGDPAVQYAQPNYRYYAFGCSTPTDPFYTTPENWPFTKIQAPAGWALFSSCPPGSASVTVAVLDSGVSRNNPDLKNVPLVGYNAVCATDSQNLSCPCGGPVSDSAGVTASMDDYGHGTYVAGIINASWNTSDAEAASSYKPLCDSSGATTPYGGSPTVGFAGLAPGATLLAVKILDCTGAGSTDSIVTGTDFAVAMGARVLNFSLGSSPDGGIDPAEKESLDNALANNCVIVAASGNDSNISGGNQQAVDFPAAYPPVIAVGASDQNDHVADYSNGGVNLDIVAPGGTADAFTGNAITDSAFKIFSTFLSPLPPVAVGSPTECGFEPLQPPAPTDPNFGVAAGTSASTPFVSGAAALVLSLYPSLSYSQVAQRLIDNADSLNGNKGWDAKTG